MPFMYTLLLSLITFSVAANDLLWEKIQREPNIIVLMRNTESSGNRDGGNMLVWDASGNCKGESILTKKGNDHAKKIGEAFARHGIKPTVISSPMCRCSETAKIAFGKYVTDPQLRQSSSSNIQGREEFQTKASILLSKHRGKSPIVFVNHRPNIDSLTFELIDIGDLLVGSVSVDGEIEVIGKIRVEP